MRVHYVVKPKADQDLDYYADYLAEKANLEVALRFLSGAQRTFALLGSQPEIGWRSRLKNPALGSLRVFRVSGFERMLIIYRPRSDGVEILRVVDGSREIFRHFSADGKHWNRPTTFHESDDSAQLVHDVRNKSRRRTTGTTTLSVDTAEPSS